MSVLSASDFPTFFEEVYGHGPYKWQSRLATQVVETGKWPELLDLPTGTGKTAALDIALFALAARPNDLPRRIVFVVDRRIIVHQAARRVECLVKSLDPDGAGVAAVVARRLRSLSPSPAGAPDGPVVRWSELRGGIVRDESWATRPDVPAVLVSTVDQVGSRLLFRGYGVSRGMRPIHAGLLGADTLFLLDEVHLARTFRTTLRAIGSRYRGSGSSPPLPDRWQVVELSATPAEEVARRFAIIDEDRRVTAPDHAPAVAELERRLGANKPAMLRGVMAPSAPAGFATAVVAACIAEAQTLLAADVRTIGVVVNRVATAVAVERGLVALGHEVILVTGRVRSIDRDAIVDRLEVRAGATRVRKDDDKAVVVVSTQAIEAGADLDLDALVTECASIDALQQRFGRVDRAGKLSADGRTATSVVLGMSSAVGTGADDPVYGPALAATWVWLGSVATAGMVDFGAGRLPEPKGDTRAGLLPPQVWCPQLFPSQLDRWVQTSTEPHADPVVAHWLHGLEERPDDVSVIWRADVTSELLALRHRDNAADGSTPTSPTELIDELFEACPPDSREAMSLPARAARQWLIAREADVAVVVSDDVSDAAAQADDGADDRKAARMAPVVLISADGVPGESQITDRPSRILPGATIVVPLDYGGIRAGSWDPTATEAVEDRATVARAFADGRGLLRLFAGGITDPGPTDGGGENVALPPFPVPAESAEDIEPQAVSTADDAAVKTWLDAYVAAAQASPGYRAGADRDRTVSIELAVAEHLASGRRTVRRVARIEAGGATSDRYLVSANRRMRRLPSGALVEPGAVVDSEPETSSFVGREVPLSVHLSDVREWGGLLAENVGLPPDVAADIALAGWFHDLGKADPRFQRMLRQGDLGSAAGLLAKSALAPGDRSARREAQQRSGYPRGARHELLSVALVERCDELMAAAHDRDLVLHLVASHHGHCRPFAPVVLDERPVGAVVEHGGVRLAVASDHQLARLDSGVPERFWLLVRRYGWWGLAWLEAVLRLADHRASEHEQRQGDDEEAVR